MSGNVEVAAMLGELKGLLEGQRRNEAAGNAGVALVNLQAGTRHLERTAAELESAFAEYGQAKRDLEAVKERETRERENRAQSQAIGRELAREREEREAREGTQDVVSDEEYARDFERRFGMKVHG